MKKTFQMEFVWRHCTGIYMASLYFRLLRISNGLYHIAALYPVIQTHALLQGVVLTDQVQFHRFDHIF